MESPGIKSKTLDGALQMSNRDLCSIPPRPDLRIRQNQEEFNYRIAFLKIGNVCKEIQEEVGFYFSK